jgi:AraC-like DNA-binding protein
MTLDLHRVRVHGSPWPGVYVTDIESGRHFARHSHEGFGFGFLTHGAQRWSSGRGEVRGFPGQIISTNPGEVHDGSPIGGPTRRWRIIHVDADAMHDLVGSRESMIAHPVIDDPAVLRRLALTVKRIAERAPAIAVEEALVDSCVSLMTTHGSAPRRELPAAANIARARERLADVSQSSPSLAELAALVGLSRYQLLRRFQRTYGLTPHAWLMQLRVERARSLIRAKCALPAAALGAGFVDQSHMNRAFVRHLGFTPGQYRNAVCAA